MGRYGSDRTRCSVSLTIQTSVVNNVFYHISGRLSNAPGPVTGPAYREACRPRLWTSGGASPGPWHGMRAVRPAMRAVRQRDARPRLSLARLATIAQSTVQLG